MAIENMLVIIKHPNKKPFISRIPKNIKYIEKFIKGTAVELIYSDILIIYNKEQKDVNVSLNKVFSDLVLKGTIIIAGNDEKKGDFKPLTKKQLAYYINKINDRDVSKELEI